LTGVGPVIASRLTEAGFVDVASVGAADAAALAAVPGIGSVRASALLTEAQQLGDPVEQPGPDVIAAKAAKWRKRATELSKQAKRLRKKANSTSSKQKRKRRRREAADIEAAAEKARRKAKKFATG
jgi:hypothetical protein